MSATYATRLDRLKRLEALLSPGAPPDQCLDGARLLAILGDAYGTGDEAARRRSLQRDLSDLVKEGRIAPVNPGGKPQRRRSIGAGGCDQRVRGARRGLDPAPSGRCQSATSQRGARLTHERSRTRSIATQYNRLSIPSLVNETGPNPRRSHRDDLANGYRQEA
jgi:hypothetical protein